MEDCSALVVARDFQSRIAAALILEASDSEREADQGSFAIAMRLPTESAGLIRGDVD